MSHFTVLVITNSVDELEQALAPFQENNMGNCPKQYMKFEDEEDGMMNDWMSGSVERVVMPDGRLLPSYAEEFRVPGEFGIGSGTHRVPENLPTRDVPLTELYPTFEAYCEDYCGYRERDQETGRYGRWENPNCKWDWWQLGGRWSGFFKLKEGKEGTPGKPGFGMSSAKPGYADQARKGDIDFDAMLKEAEDQAIKQFSEVEAALKGITEIPRTWTQVRQSMDDIDDARARYREQPTVKALREMELGIWDCPIEIFHLHEEDSLNKYIADRRCAAFSTFAVLHEGEWYEKGEMGWFGLVSDEKSKYDWSARFMDILDSLSDDAVLSVCDCHI